MFGVVQCAETRGRIVSGLFFLCIATVYRFGPHLRVSAPFVVGKLWPISYFSVSVRKDIRCRKRNERLKAYLLSRRVIGRHDIIVRVNCAGLGRRIWACGVTKW